MTVRVGRSVARRAGDDGVGHRRPRRRAGAATSTCRRLGAVVVKSLSAEPWAGNPAPRVHETAGGMLNSVGLQGPGVAALACRRAARARWPPAPRWWPASGAAPSRTTRAAAERARRTPADGRGRRGQPVVPERRRRRAPVRPRPATRPTAVVAATAACGRPRWAKLSPNTDRLVEVAAAAADAGRRGGHAGQHRAGHGDRPRRPAGRRSAAAAGGCRARPSTRSRCGPSTTCTRALPDAAHRRASAVSSTASDAVELLLAGAVGGAGRHGHLRRPPRRRSGCSTDWKPGAAATESSAWPS